MVILVPLLLLATVATVAAILSGPTHDQRPLLGRGAR